MKKALLQAVALVLVLVLPSPADSVDRGSGFLPSEEETGSILARPCVQDPAASALPGPFPFPPPAARRDSSQTWTYIFYDDADFANGYDPLADFAYEAYSAENLNVVVLQDTYTNPARVWYVDSNHQTVLLEEWGEVNMGDDSTLGSIINYAKTNYPADRYLLAVYDHGGGWRGACIDETNGGWLQMNEFQLALEATGGVDIICFTAPCLMGALESAYELRGLADVYIGSEELSGFAYWWGAIGPVCDLLCASEHLTTSEVAEGIIQAVDDADEYPDRAQLTMSATRTEDLTILAQAISAVATYAAHNMLALGANLTEARDAAWAFGGASADIYGEIDLADFIELYSSIETDPVILDRLQLVEDAFSQAIIAECHGRGQTRSHGLSIYFPIDEATYQSSYELVYLDFADDTTWSNFLAAYYAYAPSHVSSDPSKPNLSFALGPNPFRHETHLRCTAAWGGEATLRILDPTGRPIRTLLGRSDAITWDGRDNRGHAVASGVYLYMLEAGGLSHRGRVHLVR